MLANKGTCLTLYVRFLTNLWCQHDILKMNTIVYNKILKFTHSCNFHCARNWDYKNKEATVVTALEEHVVNLIYLFDKKRTDSTKMLPKWYSWFQLTGMKHNTISHIMRITIVETISAKRAPHVTLLSKPWPNHDLEQWFSTRDQFCTPTLRGTFGNTQRRFQLLEWEGVLLASNE